MYKLTVKFGKDNEEYTQEFFHLYKSYLRNLAESLKVMADLLGYSVTFEYD